MLDFKNLIPIANQLCSVHYYFQVITKKSYTVYNIPCFLEKFLWKLCILDQFLLKTEDLRSVDLVIALCAHRNFSLQFY